jgi:polar amino acid transport system substrate-binding protein
MNSARWTLAWALLLPVLLAGCRPTESPAPTSTPSSATQRSTAAPSAAGHPPVASVDDLRHATIGVLMGSAHEAWVVKNLPEATLRTYKTVADVNLALGQGKVQAALYDGDVLKVLMREDPAVGRLADPVFTFGVGVGFHKDSSELRNQFDAFVADLRGDGTYDDMVRRWIDEGHTELPDITNRGDRGVLTAGVSDVGLPFIAVQDNRLVGFDIELLTRFAAHLGRELRFSNMDFGSLVAAAASRRVDLICSSIFITPERQREVDFSQPYYRMETLVGVLKSNLATPAGATTDNAVPAPPRTWWERLVTSFQSNLVAEHRYRLILDGLWTTILISTLSVLLGTVLGCVFCLMRMSGQPWLEWPARFYIALLRGSPVLVLLMLVYYVVFAAVDLNPVIAAVLAFGMNFGAYVAEIFRSGIEGVDRGQTEAGLAMGFTPVATFRHIVLPQMLRRILPVYKGEVISLVKMTSIVGYIAVQDLTKASDIIRSRTFDAFFPLLLVALLYFLLSWVVSALIDRLQLWIDPQARHIPGVAGPGDTVGTTLEPAAALAATRVAGRESR